MEEKKERRKEEREGEKIGKGGEEGGEKRTWGEREEMDRKKGRREQREG